MSFNIRDIREISNDPLTKFTNQLAKKLSTFLTKQETDKLENKEDIYSNGEDIDVVLRFNNLNSTHNFDGSIQYFPTFEPDGVYNTCWIKGVNIGNETGDLSGFKNIATINGDPLLMDGTPFDLGIMIAGVKSTCTRFNRPTSDEENTEYMSVPDAANMQVSGISTGISYFIRFRIHDLSLQNGRSRTIFEKIDDSTPSNAVKLEVQTDGRLICQIKRAGTEYNKETAAGTIVADTIYDVWITYAVSGNVIHVYVNNVDKTLSAGSAPSWHSDHTNHDLSIFRCGAGSEGYVYGDFYDFMVERERVVSAAQVGYHYTNKWSTADIPFGQCMITNYWATYTPAPVPSFTSTSFTGTSFDV